MIQLQESIKKIIERYVVGIIPLTDSVEAGDCVIPVQSSRRFKYNDEVIIYNQANLNDSGEGEVHKVECIIDSTTIQIDEPLVQGYSSTNSFVQKFVGGTFLAGVYLGDPVVIPRYPAITIDAKSKDNEWFTLESTKSSFSIDITIYAEAADYEQSYRLMHTYAKEIEDALWRSMYPIVGPYYELTLAEPIAVGDIVFKVDPSDIILPPGAWIFVESWDYLMFGLIDEYLNNNVYRLRVPANKTFSVGDKVIKPTRHFFNTKPASIRYGTVNKDTMLRAAVLSFEAQEEVRRLFNYIDPMTH